MRSFTEKGAWAKLKTTMVLGPLIIGPVAGYNSQGEFSEEALSGAEAQIDYMNGAVHEVIGSDSYCQTSVYDSLTYTDDLPIVETSDIRESISDPCPHEPELTDQQARMIQSYGRDINRHQQVLESQEARRSVDGGDRVVTALGGLAFGLFLSFMTYGIVLDLEKRFPAKKQQIQTGNK